VVGEGVWVGVGESVGVKVCVAVSVRVAIYRLINAGPLIPVRIRIFIKTNINIQLRAIIRRLGGELIMPQRL
jgi:hypothetical protein